MSAPGTMDAWEAAWAVATEDERAAWAAAQEVIPDDEHPLARHDAERAARRTLVWALMRALSNGDLIAEGFVSDGGAERVDISPALWLGGAVVRPDDGAGRLADGRAVAGLRFRPGAPAAPPAPPAPAPAAEGSGAAPEGSAAAWEDKAAIYRAHLQKIGADPAEPSARPPTQEAVYADLRSMDLRRDDVRELQREAWGERAKRRGPRRAE